LNSREFIEEQWPWLCRRARQVSRELGDRAPGDELDLAAEAVREFLQEFERWMAQPCAVAPEAQAMTLLNLCLRHARTRRVRERMRTIVDEDPLSNYPSSDAPTLEAPADKKTEAEETATFDQHRLYQALKLLTPVRLLVFVALELPDRLDRSMLIGAARAIVRNMEDAWTFLEVARCDQALRGDGPEWKRRIAAVLRSARPLGTLPESEIKTAVNYLDQNLKRAREDLARALVGRR